jgi:polyphosphate kinase
MKKSRKKSAPQQPFLNRELSWLEFNARVLNEARDKRNPLLERVKFLAISCSNLDEFFMIRVASLKDLVHAGYGRPDPAGLTPEQQLVPISSQTHQMVNRQYSTFHRSLLPALLSEGIRLLPPGQLNGEQRAFVKNFFRSTLLPILTPMGVDASRPFPLIANRSLNLCVRIDKGPEPAIPPTNEMAQANGTDSQSSEGENGREPGPRKRLAIVQIPSVLPRLVRLPSSQGYDFILLEEIIRLHLDQLFTGVRLGPAGCFRIMRNADLDLDEEDAADLLVEIEKQLKLRPWGEAIRLEVESGFDEALERRLIEFIAISEQDIYRISGPLDLTFLGRLQEQIDRPDLRYPPYTPQAGPLADVPDIFAAIRQRDIMLHHPYDSFEPVVDLVRHAAQDPEVLAIKQTLYRVSGDSPIIRYLAEAAGRGKQVLVVVELKARFDEENNIQWAKKLEQAGCHVIYGLVGLKTHSKVLLIVRRDEDGIRRYVHLGTGNYNDVTARLYADLGLMTCSESIGADASAFFNMLSGYSAPPVWRKLIPAPYWLRRELQSRVDLEIRHARAGRKARIILKVNALVDPLMIDQLYQASQNGVRIDLVVRGICCLRPGVAGLSDHISVRSIIGRFLEHSRIFYFYNDGEEDIFLSSADWMPRNLDRRVELMFPVESISARQQIMDILNLQLKDTDRASLMQPDGSYARIDRRGKRHVDSQQTLCLMASDAERLRLKSAGSLRFSPVDQPEDDEDSPIDSDIEVPVMPVKKSSGKT